MCECFCVKCRGMLLTGKHDCAEMCMLPIINLILLSPLPSRSWALRAGQWHQVLTTSSLHHPTPARGCVLWTHSEGKPPHLNLSTEIYNLNSCMVFHGVKVCHVILNMNVTFRQLTLELPVINKPQLIQLIWLLCLNVEVLVSRDFPF